MAPECKPGIPMINGVYLSLEFLAYTVGVRPVEARFGRVRAGAVSNRSLSWLWVKSSLILPKVGLGAGYCPREHVSAVIVKIEKQSNEKA